MIDYASEIKHHKREKDRIKSEINDLESRIVVESGRRNRSQVNYYRNRINGLQMRLNEINLKISELEKMTKNKGQIQLMPADNFNVPVIDNGEITVTDTIEFDCGSYDAPEIIHTVIKTVERKIRYRDGKPVSCEEKYVESTTTRGLSVGRKNIIETSSAD